jgi:aminoglycoside phosphotransferase (APT) family kinase protein
VSDTTEIARRIGRRLARPWARVGQVRTSREVLRLVPVAVEASWHARPTPRYVAGRPRITGSGIVVPLKDPVDGPRWVVKFADSEPGRRSLERSTAALSALRLIPELASWAAAIPEVVGSGSVDEYAYVIETALPGRTPTATVWQAGEPNVLGALVAAISGLHGTTAGSVDVDEAVLAHWVDGRVTELTADRDTRDQKLGLEGIRRSLRAALDGRTLSAGWIHGDYWLGNALLDDDGRVSGIVDWESAASDELALHDLLHLVLYTRRAIERVQLGRVIRSALKAPLPPPEDEVLTLASDLAGGIDRRTAIALYWLRWVEANVRRHPGLRHNREWQHENVSLVLDAL